MSATAAVMKGSMARGRGTDEGVRLDAWTVAIVACILLLGLVMVTSASMSVATGSGSSSFYFLEHQLAYLALGLAGAGLVFAMGTERLERLATPLLILGFLLLVVVLVPGLGHRSHGSRRWLQVGALAFQASELVRVLLLVYVSSYAVRHEDELRSTASGLLKPLGVLAFAAALLLLEPDMGAATVLFVTGFALLFLAGAQLRWVLTGLLGASALFVLLVFTAAYRLKRVTGFLHPFDHPFDTGFQLVQSLIAIGRGQWFGVGLGSSVQKLFYLPEAHSDFIFAVLAEELGLAGVLVTLGLFVALAWRALAIARLAVDQGLKFQAYLAAGFGIWVGVQAFVNIGVNMGVLPTKGLTLPLMSYGGTSIMVGMVWVGLLLRVYHEATLPTRGTVLRGESA